MPHSDLAQTDQTEYLLRLSEMDDQEFLTLRHDAHDALTAEHVTSDVTERYRQVEMEFLRRAGLTFWRYT